MFEDSTVDSSAAAPAESKLTPVKQPSNAKKAGPVVAEQIVAKTPPVSRLNSAGDVMDVEEDEEDPVWPLNCSYSLITSSANLQAGQLVEFMVEAKDKKHKNLKVRKG